MTDDISDHAFADHAIQRLTLVEPSSGFEAALLAGYDAWNAERAKGPWAAWKAGLRRFCETIWPGAPVWAPASALAAALLIGAGVGAILPTKAADELQGFSLERTESFSLLESDLPQEEDL